MPRFTKERGPAGVLEVREGPDTISGAESAPTTDSDGIDATGFNTVAVSIHTLTLSPTYTLEIWLYDGHGWAQASGGDGSPASFSDLTATFTQIFNVAGFDRILVRVSALSAGTLDRVYTFIG